MLMLRSCFTAHARIILCKSEFVQLLCRVVRVKAGCEVEGVDKEGLCP